jgi:ABC-type branched-subunit amino acid transport system substrate-binding protein
LTQKLSDNSYTCTEVFEVVDSQNQRTRKILKAIYNNQMQLQNGRELFAELVRLFRREQSILIDLEHPGIPRGEAYFSLSLNNDQELHCLVMEKIEGQNLEQWLGEHGAINERQALEWLKQLATILDFIHQQNWFHRDIKPSNIMRRPNGQLVLIDFGTVRQITGTVVSGGRRTEIWSHGYTPPEQIDGGAVLQSDFYALGRTFVHLLTGIHPCDIQPNISNWREQTRYPISNSLAKLVNRLMASERSRRPKNAKVILRRLALIRLEYKIQRLLRKLWLSGLRVLRRFWLIAGLVLVSGLVGAAIAIYIYSIIHSVPPPTACDSQTQTGDKLSFGEEILVSQPQDSPQQKEQGVREVAQCNYSTAVKYLEQAWIKQRDPETLIYLNNAKINDRLNQGKIPKNRIYTIAVVAPLKYAPDTETRSQGLELLRGVAQAQDEARQQESYFKVLIANDYNQNDQVKEIAEKLVKKPDILTVVGHYSSDRTKAALPIYEKNELVLVSPSSTSVNLRSNFFFRTVPSDETAALRLATYLNKEAKKKKVAVLWTHKSDYSESLKKKFISVFTTSGDVVNDSQKFKLSNNKFNASVALGEAKKQGATAITLIPDAGTTENALNNALEVIKSDKYPDLIMVAGDSLYIERVPKEVGEMATNRHLVVAIAWHTLTSPNPEFPKSARNFWGTENVSWHTATAYDATRVLIEAIKKQPSRKGVQQILSGNQFQVQGATGEIKFDGSDRADPKVALVTVVHDCQSASGYSFVPIELANKYSGTKCF